MSSYSSDYVVSFGITTNIYDELSLWVLDGILCLSVSGYVVKSASGKGDNDWVLLLMFKFNRVWLIEIGYLLSLDP